MPDVKIRKGMDAPKVRQTNAAPKEAAGILRQQYMEKQAERQPGAKSPVQYATDRAESDGKRGAVLAADGTRRAVRKAKQRRERGEKPTDTEPRKERAPTAREPEPRTGAHPSQDVPRQRDHAPKTRQSASAKERVGTDSAKPLSPSPQHRGRRQVVQAAAQKFRDTPLPAAARPHTGEAVKKTVAPKTRQSAVKERVEVQSSQPALPSAQVLRRQKVVQDTVRARQEARRTIDAEISRVDAAANTEAAGKLSSKLPYRSKSGADIPRTPPCFAEKPGKAEGKAARPRISGGGAPSKPAFALKERAAAGRQLQTNTATATQ